MRTTFVSLAALALLSRPLAGDAPPNDYRVPDNAAVVRLLTGTQTPQVLFHSAAGRVALVYRETLVPVARLARPHLGLAGYLIDPDLRSSAYDSRVEKVVVVDIGTGNTVATWERTEPSLDDIRFSPDGDYLSAVSFREGPPRLAIFDIGEKRERTMRVAVNPAFEAPCEWTTRTALICRLVPDATERAPPVYPSPNVIEHPGGEARTRTYTNMLESAAEEAQFEYYFSSTLARVTVDDDVKRFDATTGLLARVRVSPDHKYALVIRLQRPYSHLLKADKFGRRIELWDLTHGKEIDAPGLPQRKGVTATRSIALRTFVWKPGAAVLGWTEGVEGGDERWMQLEPPFTEAARQVVRHPQISAFGWTSMGTPYFSSTTDNGTRVQYYVVRNEGEPALMWQGAVKDVYNNPGRAVRTNGDRGPVLEVGRRVFLASDGLSADGPAPYVDALHLDTLETERLLSAPPGVYERVIGVTASDQTLLTVRESETEAPRLFAVRRDERKEIGPLANPFPELDGVSRANVSYLRKDGVRLNGMLYLPRDRDASKPLPTLVWIYPAEFAEGELAEQMDSRRFRFHQIKEASPIAAVLEGYALLLNPTVPIVGEGEEANDTYVPQLVSSMEAAIDYLVAAGVSDRDRIAVAGRSYGAFSTANLLVHTDLFKTGIAISGAYNRTLTPFGFQHERRSFWEATDFYTRMSPFFRANDLNEPLLLMHGGADDNPGTPTLQARRFFHALVGNGAHVRYVELPYERHHYRARENVLHTSAEMLEWLDRTIGRDGG